MTSSARTACKRLLYYASALFVVITIATLLMRPYAARMHRSAGVPKDAINRPSIYGDRWLKCSYDEGLHIDRCQIWSEGGRLLRDEEFLPYGGGSALRAEQIQIARGRQSIAYVWTHAGRISHISLDDWVCLKSGRILIAKSREAETTRVLKWLYSPTPERRGLLEAQGCPAA